jgi:trans-aconitate 2-methyltransferase
MWNADQYLKFSDERSRPFVDLLAQVKNGTVRQIVDLGCGPGNLTRTLLERWPAASVIGIDSSPEMLQKGAHLAVPGRLGFQQADIVNWSADVPVDLIVSNAAMHWLSDHAAVLTHWAGMLSPTGSIAVQMPNRFQTMSQQLVDDVVADSRWAARLSDVGLHRDSVKPLSWYIPLLHDLGFHVNAWETTYFHSLTGDNPVLDWLKGTALPPLLERLDEHEAADFLQILGDRLKAAYPARNGVTVWSMPRLFFVASRSIS